MRFNLGPDLSVARAAALVAIDAAAETARLRYVTGGAGQVMEYQATEREVRALIARGLTPAPDWADYPMLRAERLAIQDATGQTPTLAALVASVKAEIDAVEAALAAIRRLRLAAKRRIEAAITHAEIRTATTVSWPSPT